MEHSNGAHGDISRVLVLGDNYAGSSIVEALIKANLEVHVACQYSPSDAGGATYHKTDKRTTLTSLFSTVQPDLVISTEHGGSFESQNEIIDSAIEAGVLRFMPAEFGHDTLNTGIQDRLPPYRERAKTLKYLQEQARDGRISWAALATGVTLDRGLQSGNLGFDLKWQSVTMHGRGSERFAASTSAWIGSAVVATIRHWEDVKNQYLYAAGMTLCADDVVRWLEHVTGKSFEVGRAYPDECVREARRRIDQGWPDAGMFLLERSVLYDESLEACTSFETSQDAKEKLGLGGEDLQSVIKSVVHEQQHHGGKADCGCD